LEALEIHLQLRHLKETMVALVPQFPAQQILEAVVVVHLLLAGMVRDPALGRTMGAQEVMELLLQ
jgi:hypothetical protein